jgi:hypothetical protein
MKNELILFIVKVKIYIMLDHVEKFLWKSKCSYNMYLMEKLHSIHLEEDNLMLELIHNIKEMTTQMVGLGEWLEDTWIMHIMLNSSMTSKYKIEGDNQWNFVEDLIQ